MAETKAENCFVLFCFRIGSFSNRGLEYGAWTWGLNPEIKTWDQVSDTLLIKPPRSPRSFFLNSDFSFSFFSFRMIFEKQGPVYFLNQLSSHCLYNDSLKNLSKFLYRLNEMSE